MNNLEDLAAEGQQRFVEDYSERDNDNLCRLCEEREATEFKSPVTGLPQYCRKCLYTTHRG